MVITLNPSVKFPNIQDILHFCWAVCPRVFYYPAESAFVCIVATKSLSYLFLFVVKNKCRACRNTLVDISAFCIYFKKSIDTSLRKKRSCQCWLWHSQNWQTLHQCSWSEVQQVLYYEISEFSVF